MSELRKRVPHPNVLAWSQANSGAAGYISVLVVGDIRQGIERVRPRDPKQANALEAWLDRLIYAYEDRVLPVSVAVAEEWGRLAATPQAPPTVDGMMAATAKVHRLILVTRNVADVARTGVSLVNPFEID